MKRPHHFTLPSTLRHTDTQLQDHNIQKNNYKHTFKILTHFSTYMLTHCLKLLYLQNS